MAEDKIQETVVEEEIALDISSPSEPEPVIVTEKKTKTKEKSKPLPATYWGTGRRKEAVARVRLVPGSGKIMVNNKTLEQYFGLKKFCILAVEPLDITANTESFDVHASISGGGVSGQADALRHGIARALLEVDIALRAPLKKAGMLARDAREKERRKYGLKKARKRPQFSKR